MTAPSCRARPRDRSRAGRAYEWCCLLGALGLTLLFTARMMAPALQEQQVVQDDARQHVFWMARFRDPELFANDLIADYFAAQAPPGYTALYWLLSWGIDPLLASKLLPPVLGLVTALFSFLLTRRLHPSPAAAFLAAVLLSWLLWRQDDLVSGTPRAFLPPLLAGQVWALAAGRLVLAVGLVVLAALFYPAGGALGLGLLGLQVIRRRGWRLEVVRERRAWLALAAGVVLVVGALVPSRAAEARFGPVVLASEARAMPEYGPAGRNAFFIEDGFQFWVASSRSGLDTERLDRQLRRVPILFEYAAVAAWLPILLLLRRRVPGGLRLGGPLGILLQLLVVSFGLFFLAHAVLFRLHYPNRFVKTSVPLVLAVAAALVLIAVMEIVGGRLARVLAGRRARSTGAPSTRDLAVAGLAVACAAGVVLYPAPADGRYKVDRYPLVTEYLRSLPKDALVAGPAADLDFVPTFAQRPILAGFQYAFAFHHGYYDQLRRRLDDLIAGYYAEDLSEVVAFAARYGVAVFLVDRGAFQLSEFEEAWTGVANTPWEPFTPSVRRRLRATDQFALLKMLNRCAAVQQRGLAAVPTSCLQRQAERSAGPP